MVLFIQSVKKIESATNISIDFNGQCEESLRFVYIGAKATSLPDAFKENSI